MILFPIYKNLFLSLLNPYYGLPPAELTSGKLFSQELTFSFIHERCVPTFLGTSFTLT